MSVESKKSSNRYFSQTAKPKALKLPKPERKSSLKFYALTLDESANDKTAKHRSNGYSVRSAVSFRKIQSFVKIITRKSDAFDRIPDLHSDLQVRPPFWSLAQVIAARELAISCSRGPFFVTTHR